MDIVDDYIDPPMLGESIVQRTVVYQCQAKHQLDEDGAVLAYVDEQKAGENVREGEGS